MSRTITQTRRAGFRWKKIDRFILIFFFSDHRVSLDKNDFIDLCATIGRSPRSILEFMRRDSYLRYYIKKLPFTPSEIEHLSAQLAVTVRKKDPSIKWDRRPRKRDSKGVKFQLVRTR